MYTNEHINGHNMTMIYLDKHIGTLRVCSSYNNSFNLTRFYSIGYLFLSMLYRQTTFIVYGILIYN